MVNVVGSAYVDIHAQDKHFEAEVRRAVKKIGKQDISINANVLLSKANTNLAKFRKRNNDRPIEIDLNVNTDLAEKRTEDFYAENDGKVLSMNLEINHTSAWESLAKLKNSVAARGILSMRSELDLDFMHEQVEQFEAHYAENPIMLTSELDTAKAYQSLQTLQAVGEGNPVDVVADADIVRAEAILAHLTRTRKADIVPNIDRSSLRDAEQLIASSSTRAFRWFGGGGRNPLSKIFNDPEIQDAIEGFANATAGIIPPKAIKTVVTSLAANFEELSVATAKWGTVAGAAAGAAGAALGFGARLIEDITQVGGVIAAIPAIIATVVASTQSLKMAWGGMSDAIQLDAIESEKAIAKLPPKARATARAIRDVNVAVNEVTDTKYWDRLGDSVVRAANAIKGPLTAGMGQVAVAMADNTTALSKSIEDFGKDGSMKTTFDNMVKGLQNATGGTKTFSEALLTLTEEGSKRVPELGEWFTRLGTKFNNFIKRSAESGAILDWIDTGVQRLQELGSIVVSTGEMFGVLEQAASDAGIGGLTELAEGFQKAAEVAKSPIFRMTLIDLFRDAKISAENLGEGLSHIFDGLMETAPQIGDILISTSEAMEAVLTGVGTMFSDTGMMDGLVRFFEGVSKGAQDLGPTFQAVGDSIGHLGEMGGVLIENLVPGLNILMGTFEGFLANMKDGWMAVNPVLNEFVQIITTLISGPIKTAGTVLGGLLQIIADIPPGILTAVTAMIGLSKLFATIGAMKIGGKLLSSIPVLGTAIAAMTGGVGMSFVGMKDKMGKASGQAVAGVKRMSTGSSSVLKSMMGTYAATGLMMAGQFDRSREAIDKTKGAANGAKTAVKGFGIAAQGAGRMMSVAFAPLKGMLVALLPLAVIAGIISIIGDVQYNAQVAAQSIDTLAESFDGLTGKMNAEGIQHAMDRIGKVDNEGFFGMMDKISDWAGWSQPVEKDFEAVGLSMEGVREKLSGSIKDVKEYSGTWNHVSKAFEKASDGGQSAMDFMDEMERADPKIYEKLGLDAEKFKGASAQVQASVMAGMGGMTEEVYLAAAAMKSLQETLEHIGNSAPTELFKFAEEGGDATLGLREALSQANDMVGRLNENFATLNTRSASVDQKLSAFRDNLTLTGSETLSNTGGFKEYYEGLETVKTTFAAVTEATGGSARKLIKSIKQVGSESVVEFDHTSKAARDMHTALESTSTDISRVAVAAYDAARNSGKSVSEATKAAQDAAGPLVKNLRATLTEMDVMPAQIDAIIDSMGLMPEDIETAISVDGAEAARREIIMTQVLADALSSRNYDAMINIITEGSEVKLEALIANGEDWTRADLNKEVMLRVQNAGIDPAIFWQEVAAMDGDVVQAMINLGITGKEQADSAIKDTKDKGSGTIELQLKSIGETEIRNQIRDLVAANPKILAEIDGDPKKAEAKIRSLATAIFPGIKLETDADLKLAQDKLNAFMQQHPEVLATLTAETSTAKTKIDEATKDKNTKTTVDADTNPALVKANKLAADLKVPMPTSVTMQTDGVAAQVEGAVPKEVVSTVSYKPETTLLPTFNGARPLLQTVKMVPDMEAVNSITSTTSISIKASVSVDSGPITTIREDLNGLSDKTVYVKINADMGPVATAKSDLNSIKDKSATVTVKANVGPITAVKEGMATIKNKSATVKVSTNTVPITTVKTAMEGIKDKSAKVTVTAPTTSVTSLASAVRNIKDKTVKVLGNNSDAMAKVRQVVAALAGIRDKTFTVRAINSQAIGAINAVNNMSVRDKTNTITTIRRTIDQSNNGNFFPSVTQYAKGGVNNDRISKAIQRNRGKSENHVAQIAKGSSNYRIWSEPETGGEAYIPLSKAKRGRSLTILQQVADHFGLSLSQQFANGGFLGGQSSGNVTSYATGGTSKKLSAAQKKAQDRQREKAAEARKIYLEAIKDMRALIQDIQSGISGVFSKVQPSELTAEITTIRKQASQFMSTYRKSRPADAKDMGRLFKSLGTQQSTSRMWASKRSNENDALLLANNVQRRQRTKTTRDNIVSGVTLRDYEHAISLLTKKLEGAQKSLDAVKSLHESAASSLSSSMSGEFNMGSLLGSADAFGYRAPVSAKSIGTYAKGVVTKMKGFHSQLYQLRKAGYNPFLVNEIAGMGLEDGMFIAAALLADKSQLKDINGSYTAINGQFKQDASDGIYKMMGGLANTIGDRSADAMYNAGISIQQGLVRGLTADVSALERAARTLSNSLVSKFKKILGIRSPSRVFAAEARFIPQGIIMGLDQEQANLDKRMRSLVTTKAMPVDFSRGAPSQTRAGFRDDILDGGYSSPISLTVNPAPGMSEEQIGRAAARELMFRMDYR